MVFQENVNLTHLNTMGVPAVARYFTSFKNLSDLQTIAQHSPAGEREPLCLGGGSNILFIQPYEGLVLKNQIKGIVILETTESMVRVQVGAGELWNEWVHFCVTRGWPGVENLSLIPGTVGAAPIQNIGAYGVEVREVIESVHIFDLNTGTQKIISAAECEFGYRDSVFKRPEFRSQIITHVIFKLDIHAPLKTHYGRIEEELFRMNIPSPSIQAVAEAVTRIRRSKLPDPEILGNAGSFFKNPILPNQQVEALRRHFPNLVGFKDRVGFTKVAAGWLIEHSGLKGYSEGPCGVHQEQALVLVNYGGATGAQILRLAEKVQSQVLDCFGIHLEMEVTIL